MSPAVKLGYCPDAGDMRLDFDGLCNLVRRRLHADPLSGHLFIFRNRTADRLKVLYWGGHGLCLWCQRLEAGRYHFPEAPAEAVSVELTAGQFQMGLDGIDLARVRRFQRLAPRCGRGGGRGQLGAELGSRAGGIVSMDAPLLPPEAPLPDDVAALQRMVRELLAEVARLRSENTELRSKLDQALKHRFGRRSERRRPPRLAAAEDRPGRRRDPHGRSPLPEDLPRREVVSELTEAEQRCPGCGQPRVCIGSQATEQLDLEPARLCVLRTVRKTYACAHCDPTAVPPEQRLQTAGPAQVGPLAKGLCGPGLLAQVRTAKFADPTPLHRLAGQLARAGVPVAEATLGDWVRRAAALLEPLVALRHQRLLLSRVLHGDDTAVKLRVPGADRTRKAHLWTCIGDADYPYVVFDFTADYSATGPEAFLAGYRGYLQADALAQYEGLYGADRIVHVCCWAHARRKVVAAAEAGDERATAALEWIRQLYAIERDLPPLLPPADAPPAQQRRAREEQRRQRRQQHAQPVLDERKHWLDEQRPQVLPKSPLGQAVGYALNHWEALVVALAKSPARNSEQPLCWR